ncbi:MAG: HPr family phosphocarrier protein [Calditrichaeota bacterium]|nr:HPr family phosphocarrier protein [Calditrichota bacterium]RQV92558.1 MAG: HPr family phosphocarrier protein [bacterium]RQV99632.1 MAG: HPr family phosphocarrier protein [Calditrichota bacterium]
MIQKSFKIINKTGLHARPAAILVKTTGKFKSQIFITKDGEKVNGKSIMGIMTLAAERGSIIEVTVDGPDEKAAMDAIEKLITNQFYE